MPQFGENNRGRRLAFAATATLVLASACMIDMGSPSSGGTPGSGTVLGRDVPGDAIRLRFRNLTTSEAVDVGFHVADMPPENLPDDLFVSENFFAAEIGLGANGRIAPRTEDVIEIVCAPGITLGTDGGSFVDVDTGEIRGVGNSIWLVEGEQFSCGADILFEYLLMDETYRTFLTLVGR